MFFTAQFKKKNWHTVYFCICVDILDIKEKCLICENHLLSEEERAEEVQETAEPRSPRILRKRGGGGG